MNEAAEHRRGAAARSTFPPAMFKHRGDLRVIVDLIGANTRVLDIGCADGALLALLAAEKGVDGRGIELSQAGVNACVARGLSVVQGDADTDLKDYPSDVFDYVILSQTLQTTRAPRVVVEELLRIGRRAVISFPNFAHWRNRAQLALEGRMPVTDYLPYRWYDTPNIHFCTIRDFVALCAEIGAQIEESVALDAHGRRLVYNVPWFLWNLIADQAIFVLRRADTS